MYRLRARRTAGANPPTLLLPGELAYSDANKRLYVGRYDGSIATFESDLSLAPIVDAIAAHALTLAALDTTTGEQATALAALALDVAQLDTTTGDQAATIAAHALALAALDTTTGDQAAALAALALDVAQLNTTTGDQAAALAAVALDVAQLNTTTGDQAAALAAVALDVAQLDTTTGEQATALAAVESTNTAQQQAIAALTARPFGHGFTYDQASEPINPSAGETWRERFNGAIIGHWEWSSFYAEWLDLESYYLHSAVNTGSGATATNIADYLERKRLLVSCTVQAVATSGTFDASNHLTITPSLRNYQNAIIAQLSAAALVFNSSPRAVTTAIGAIYTFSKTQLSRGGLVGTPGAVSTAIHLKVRDVRV